MAKKMVLLVLILAVAAAAAEKEKPEETAAPIASKVLVLKYAKPDQFYVLSNFGAKVLVLPGTQALAVSGPPEVVRAIDEYVKLVDVPRTAIRNVEVIGYLLVTSKKPLAQSEIPPVLEPVVKQLQNLFAYQGFTVAQTLSIRGREGEQGGTNGIMGWPLDEKLPPGRYAFNYRRLGIAPDPKGALVRLEGLQFRASVPQALTAGQGQVQFQDVGITTDVDLREGQKVVIGKANADAAGSALVLVLNARVME